MNAVRGNHQPSSQCGFNFDSFTSVKFSGKHLDESNDNLNAASQVRIVILVVAFNGIKLLEDCLSSVLAADASGLNVHYVVLDNASSDGTGQFVRERFPGVTLVELDENLGFAEGNNQALREAQKRFTKIDYVYLLNQDTIVDRKFLVEAVRYLEANDSAGAVQSLLKLHPETELINTAGNALHFLGFGLPTFYRELCDLAPASGPIGYPSGAAVLIRGDWIQAHGLFSNVLFMYLEDAELGWQLHLAGQPPHLCATSIVYHKYTFSSTIRSYEYLERNRWWLIAVHYKLPTIIVLLPALLLMEVGQLIYATSQGLLGAKWRAVAGFMHPNFLGQAWVARRRTQSARMVGDRQMLLRWSGTIDSPYLNGWMVRRVANPALGAWHRLACWCVRW